MTIVKTIALAVTLGVSGTTACAQRFEAANQLPAPLSSIGDVKLGMSEAELRRIRPRSNGLVEYGMVERVGDWDVTYHFAGAYALGLFAAAGVEEINFSRGISSREGAKELLERLRRTIDPALTCRIVDDLNRQWWVALREGSVILLGILPREEFQGKDGLHVSPETVVVRWRTSAIQAESKSGEC